MSGLMCTVLFNVFGAFYTYHHYVSLVNDGKTINRRTIGHLSRRRVSYALRREGLEDLLCLAFLAILEDLACLDHLARVSRPP